MEVILKESVKNVGEKDEVVEVADGHARNYLIPKGLAVRATEAELAKLKEKRKAKERKKEKKLQAAKEKAAKLEDVILEIPVKAGETGKLFGSVTTNDIAENIEEETGVEIDKRKVELEENIQTLGTKKVTINLHKDVSATVKVKVTEA